MALKTTDTDPTPTDPIQIDAVTKGATLLDYILIYRIMECGIRTCPVGRMGVVGIVTTISFTTSPSFALDTDIEPGIASRAAGLTMAVLTDRQISFGNGTMNRAFQKGAVKGMRHMTGADRMTAAAVKTGGKAAGSSRAAMQVSTVALRTGGGSVDRRIAAVAGVRVGPVDRMDAQRWCGVKGVAGITAGYIPASLQLCPVAGDAVGESGSSQSV